jgi:hypothetical protein
MRTETTLAQKLSRGYERTISIRPYAKQGLLKPSQCALIRTSNLTLPVTLKYAEQPTG